MRSRAIVAVLVLVASPVTADQISLYVGPQNPICALEVVPFSVVSVYVVHDFAWAGTAGSRWRVTDTSGYLRLGFDCGTVNTQGDPYTGIALEYDGCQGSYTPLCRLDFLKFQATQGGLCYQLNVEPYPGDASVIVTNCSAAETEATGGYFTFDAGALQGCDDCTTATESVTWGAIKSLYR